MASTMGEKARSPVRNVEEDVRRSLSFPLATRDRMRQGAASCLRAVHSSLLRKPSRTKMSGLVERRRGGERK